MSALFGAPLAGAERGQPVSQVSANLRRVRTRLRSRWLPVIDLEELAVITEAFLVEVQAIRDHMPP
ncbi:hypothetical protein [Arthrobacter tecti]